MASAACAQPDDIRDFVMRERMARERGGEHAEHHGGLRADHRTETHCKEGARGQVERGR